MKNNVIVSTDNHVTKPVMDIGLLYHCCYQRNYTLTVRHTNLSVTHLNAQTPVYETENYLCLDDQVGS
jgi:hypothetical protein